MSTEQESKQYTDTTEQILAGTLLKEKREELGLTQRQIADRLRLRVAIIEKIETNDFDGELVATFTRGYLRSYAKAVGLDEATVLDTLEHHDEAQHGEQQMQSFSRKTNKEKHDSRIMKLTWGIFIVIIGISSIWWLQNQQKDTLSIFPADDTSEVTDAEAMALDEEGMEMISGENIDEVPSEPASPVQRPVIEEAEVTDTTQGEQAAPEALSETQLEVVEPILEEASPVAVEVADNTKKVTMSFRADCWIQITDASGKVLSTGIKSAGQTLNLSGEAPFKVILGAPEAVSITLASEPFDLSGYTSGKVARFTLP
ncbi:cytoskeleton protein RodZ [Vibrio sp. ZSDZ34]|uniref:Cytoskeleton protein RodZ n=1 Tax=Vibrio gelatinilyticus TaxID=2893468 RepID=A0A9X2AXH8_9VIBR|nr:cytoskeleton protein RodZ [Vibrio gelatinilyticus]MCJ2378400.1 cytoskeleton protein RodZ [Vibrio gelatinilyticus]